MKNDTQSSGDIESPYAWTRLIVSLMLMTIGGSGMYSVTVVLPQIQAEFGISRSGASLAYSLTMIGFGLGGILMCRLSDRFGVFNHIGVGTLELGRTHLCTPAHNATLVCSLP